MKDTRRSFLKKSALISASVLIPDFLKAFGSLANPQQFVGKRLVVIQLSGGNDGLNCVVPFRNDEYFNGIASKFIKTKEGKTPANPFFYPTVNKNIPKLKNKIKSILSKNA
jgi:uncharacterized protein (DUF1501 family)